MDLSYIFALQNFLRWKGFPNFDGLETTTVFGGILQPFVLLRWIRTGNISPKKEANFVFAFVFVHASVTLSRILLNQTRERVASL